jgi:hypothetical protein
MKGYVVSSDHRTVAGEEKDDLRVEMRPSRPRTTTSASAAGRMKSASQSLTDGTHVQK